MPIASNDADAVEIATPPIRDIGYEPVLVGDMEIGKYPITEKPLAGEPTPEEVRRIASTLD